MTSFSNGTPFPPTTRDAARWYSDHGIRVIPAGYRKKYPIDPQTEKPLQGWDKLEPTLEDAERMFSHDKPVNVFALNGRRSGNLVDIDLDSQQARLAAEVLLPNTGMIFGRESAPRSHRVYRITEADSIPYAKHQDIDGACHCEFRGDGTGTVFPGSTHVEGEAITWNVCTAPAEISLAVLQKQVRAVAAAAVLARWWPAKGSLHDARMSLAGGLLRAGWDHDLAETFLEAVSQAAGNTPGNDCGGVVRSTAEKLEQGDTNVRGWPSLAQLIGERGNEVISKVRNLLGIQSQAPTQDKKSKDEPWPTPVPLDDVPEVPDFPVHVLPITVQKLVTEIASSLPVPMDFAGVPVLALVGGAIANSRRLAVTRTHRQSPCLYAAYTGLPGTKKSAPLGILRAPFDSAQWRYIEDHKAAVDAWEQAKRDAEEGDDVGPRPVLRRCVVSDVTTESLAMILGDNPRGVMELRNELSAFMSSMNQYKGGKGQDRQVRLNLWDNDPICIDRKSDKDRGGIPLYVSDPFCGVVGSIQPDVLNTLRGESRKGAQPNDDGFTDRFLFAYPKDIRVSGELWREVSQASLDNWARVVERLLGLTQDEYEGRPLPVLVQLAECGRQAWKQFTDAHADEMNAENFPTHLRGPWAKMTGYCARLALILHYLRWACDEVTTETVDGEDMTRAAELIAYFKGHARKVYAHMESDPQAAVARKVAAWIKQTGETRLQKRDIHQGNRSLFRSVERLDPVLTLLEKHFIIRPEPATSPSQRGRPASPWYEVNYLLLQAPHNTHKSHKSDPNPISEVSEISEALSHIRDEEVPDA